MKSHLHVFPGLESVEIPDSAFTRTVTEFVRDAESELLPNHSGRVYYFAALAGVRNEGRRVRLQRSVVPATRLLLFHKDFGLA